MDYLFTEEGAVLSSYGIEGVTYELNDQGAPQFTETIFNNPDGIPARAAMGYFATLACPDTSTTSGISPLGTRFRNPPLMCGIPPIPVPPGPWT